MVLSCIPAPQTRAFVFGTAGPLGKVGIWTFGQGIFGILGMLSHA